MQYFYDGQIRRYLVQIIRLLSNFVVRYGDGTLVRVPVVYGDADRQVAAILNQNSENAVQSSPKIAVYITDLELDTSRLADASFVGKVHIRERAVDESTGEYLNTQGENYTIERLMPTPYKLTFKVDIWSSSNEQKLQILEQILMLFNPSLEIQTTDNYVDWTSLSVVDLNSVTYSSRTVPVGTTTEIDIATLSLITPIYISPPAKVKRLGVVTSIIANIFGNKGEPYGDYIDGLGVDHSAGLIEPSNPLFSQYVTIGNYDIEVVNGIVKLISSEGVDLAWTMLIDQNPNIYKASLTRLYLKQPTGSYVVGYIALNSLDETIMVASWDADTYPSNTFIDSQGRIENIDPDYDSGTGRGTFDAIIDPLRTGPGSGLPSITPTGTRYLILESIGGGIRDTFISEKPLQRINTNVLHRKVDGHRVFVDGVEVSSGSLRIPNNIDTGNYYILLDDPVSADVEITYELYQNETPELGSEWGGADAWKNQDGTDLVAGANDIIEWTGTRWNVVFSSKEYTDMLIYQTNVFPGRPDVQYKWNGVSWIKSFEGVYRRGEWRLEL